MVVIPITKGGITSAQYRDENKLQEALYRYEHLVRSPYLCHLDTFTCTQLRTCTEPLHIIHIESLPNMTQINYATYLLNAFTKVNETIAVLLIAKKEKYTLYLILKGACNFAYDLLKNGLTQIFPNCVLSLVPEPKAFLETLFNPYSYTCLASSVTTLNVTYSSPFLTDFTHLVGASSKYVALFLAEPIDSYRIQATLKELYSIYDILAEFSQTNCTNYKSDAKTVSHSSSEAKTHSCGSSSTNTEGNSGSISCNTYHNISASTPFSYIAQRARTPTQSHSSHIPQEACTLNSKDTLCSSLSKEASKNINATILFNRANGNSTSCSSSNAEGKTSNNALCITATHSNSMSHTDYHSFSFSSLNKYIQDCLIFLEATIKRYHDICTHNSFNFSNYFFSHEKEISLRAAYSYLGLAQSTYALSPNVVNYWFNESLEYPHIFKSLQQLNAPQFYLPDSDLIVSSSLPLLSSEIMNTMFLSIS